MHISCETCEHFFHDDPEHGGFGMCNKLKKVTHCIRGSDCREWGCDLGYVWDMVKDDPEKLEMGMRLRARPSAQYDDYQTMGGSVKCLGKHQENRPNSEWPCSVPLGPEKHIVRSA